MNIKNYLKIITLNLINLQLVLTPTLSYAADDITAKDIIGGVEEIGSAVLGGIKKGIDNNRQFRQQAQFQNALNAIVVQPIDFGNTNPFFAQKGCLVLPALTNNLSDDLQCQPPVDPNLIGLYKQIQQIAENNRNQFESSLVDSNVSNASPGVNLPNVPGSVAPAKSSGKSCYERAINELTTDLKARADSFNVLQNQIDDQVRIFEAQSEPVLDQIKQNQAILTGQGDPEFLANLRLEERFTDPQCRTIFAGDQFKSLAAGGLRAIGDELEKERNKAIEFNGRTRDLEKEITDISSQLAKEIQRSDLGGLKLNGGVALTSRLGVEEFPAFKAILNRNDIQKDNEIKNIQRDFEKLGAGGDEANILNSILSESSEDVSVEIADFERKTKNDCLNNLVDSNFQGANGLLSKLEDPNISDKLNKEADSSFKNFVSSTLSDSNLSVEEKIKIIRDEESKGNNSRLTLVTGKSISIRGQQVGASTRLKTSDIIGVFESNCRDQFDNDLNSKGKSKRDIISKLKSFSNKYQSTKSTFASRVQSDIRKELLECTKDTTTGKAQNSCGSALDTQSANFCFGTAKTCSDNMRACFDRTRQEVDKLEFQKIDLAKKHKAIFKSFFRDPLDIRFRQFEAVFKAQSRNLDQIFKAGTLFETATDFKLDLKFSKDNLLEGIDPALRIEDPAKFASEIKENLKKVQEKVVQQNGELLQAINSEKDKILANYQTEKQKWDTLAKACKSLVDQHINQLTQKAQKDNEKIAEDNKKLKELCSKVSALNSNPLGGEPASLAEDLLKSSVTQGDSRAIGQLRELDRILKSTNNESRNPFLSNPTSSKSRFKQLTIAEFCNSKEAKKSFDLECTNFVKFCDDGGKPTCEKMSLDLDIKKLCIDKQGNIIKTNARKCKKAAPPALKALTDLRNDEKKRVIKILHPACVEDTATSGTKCSDIEFKQDDISKLCQNLRGEILSVDDERCPNEKPKAEELQALSASERLALAKSTEKDNCVDAKEKGKACDKVTGQLRTAASQLSQAKALSTFGEVQVAACRAGNNGARSTPRIVRQAADLAGQAIGGSTATGF